MNLEKTIAYGIYMGTKITDTAVEINFMSMVIHLTQYATVIIFILYFSFYFCLWKIKIYNTHVFPFVYSSYIEDGLSVCARSVNAMSYRIKHVLDTRFIKMIPEINSLKFLYFFFLLYLSRSFVYFWFTTPMKTVLYKPNNSVWWSTL